jgi:hypothetical protein
MDTWRRPDYRPPEPPSLEEMLAEAAGELEPPQLDPQPIYSLAAAWHAMREGSEAPDAT